MDNFAALILTYGRPDKVLTYYTLRKQGYTGRIVFVIDDTDAKGDEYRERFGGEPGVEIYCFDKKAMRGSFDIGDNNLDDFRNVIFARNAVADIVVELGLEHFLVLDDDYFQFIWRFTDKFEWAMARHFEHRKDSGFYTSNLDAIFKCFVEFLAGTPSHVKTIAMAQGGDFIGGQAGAFGQCVTLRRKAMNSFFCSSDRPIGWLGRINEDVTTYVVGATRGDVYFTLNQIALNQPQTQSSSGGLTEFYLATGTYVKSFYSVMYHPSGTTVKMLNSRSNPRLHHSIDSNKTNPKILRESVRKASA